MSYCVILIFFFPDDQQSWESFYFYWTFEFSSSVNYLLIFLFVLYWECLPFPCLLLGILYIFWILIFGKYITIILSWVLVIFTLLKFDVLGLPWWSSGLVSVLPMQGAWVWSLVGELDPTCMLQLQVRMPQLKILHAATKTLHSQNK